MNDERKYAVAVLHGAGYVARELLQAVARHPGLTLTAVSSRSRKGESVDKVHPSLRGIVEATFVAGDEIDYDVVDVVFSCGPHGKNFDEIVTLDASGFPGVIVDLSANFRLADPAAYQEFYGFEHGNHDLLSRFEYGLPERNRKNLRSATRIANPGCFATGVALTLAPIAERCTGVAAHLVAMTGASGSGITAKATTHFPDRDGNARVYNAWRHRHLPEINQMMPNPVDLSFIPASGPWTYGIWGVSTVTGVPADVDVKELFDSAYADQPFVRLTDNGLPELRHAARTPFCDIGWQRRDDGLVAVGFALDNLLKGAATTAIQNANLALGLNEKTGLIG